MDHLFLKRCLAVFLLLNLMLPLWLGLAHALESHRDAACHPETESHVHKGKTDCGFLHVVAPNVHSVAASDLNGFVPFWPELIAKATSAYPLNWALQSHTRRGPPEFVFFL